MNGSAVDRPHVHLRPNGHTDHFERNDRNDNDDGIAVSSTPSSPQYQIQQHRSPTPPTVTATPPTSSSTAASLSPMHLETPTVSGEEDDYRSETSSEMNMRDSRRLRRMEKPVMSSYSNHRDLSMRLKRAVQSNHTEEDEDGEIDNSNSATSQVCFDDTLIGTDVVLCVRGNSNGSADNEHNMTSDEMSKEKQQTTGKTHKFHAHRFMLAASSEPFRVMLTGNMRESNQREVEIYGIEPQIVEKMLMFIYTGEVVADLENVLGMLIAAEMYELEALRSMCKSFVLDHAHEIFRDQQIVELPEKLLLEIIEHDELQIRELALLEALVMWGEARVASSDKSLLDILSDLMEHVRFPTMSVSDLYGKVRPLVREGVIHESLLTEALFYHLKWGTPSGRSSKRMKPRALTAKLRKRKRVSFIQHVSFQSPE